MDSFIALLDRINAVMLSVPVLLALLGTGVLFTFWSGFCQYRSLTHGVGLVSGKWQSGKGPGAISHFQALSAALSATVGLGNIAGVAIAVELGGPGAVFWMWVVGFAGMAVKSFEVTLSMLYRNTDDQTNPHGGTMWVARNGLPQAFPGIGRWGGFIGGLFTLPLILFAVTGGNMFQAWSVATNTEVYFGVPTWVTGVILAVAVGMVILGGIRRIGQIAGMVVPFMCGLYLLCGIGVIIMNAEAIPGVFKLIFYSAFNPTDASGAFMGASVGTAFIFGMKRALFSSEAGLGSAPIAHSAVKTSEPATEGVVAGLEPFIDTIVVCTITALVILSSGAWNRAPTAQWQHAPAIEANASGMFAPTKEVIPSTTLRAGDTVFVLASDASSEWIRRIYGEVQSVTDGQARIVWSGITPPDSAHALQLAEPGVFKDYPGAALTAFAFDSAVNGLGRWMVSITIMLFALSTIITWSYYGEQGWVYLTGGRAVTLYRVIWCALIIVPCLGFIKRITEVDTISTVALGFMMAVNLPLLWALGSRGIAAWKDYFRRLDAGEITEV